MIILIENEEDYQAGQEGCPLLREVSPWQIQGLLLCSSPAAMGGPPLFYLYISTDHGLDYKIEYRATFNLP